MSSQPTYNQLMKQISDLQKQAEEIKKSELTKIISEIRERIAAYGITAADLGFTRTRTATGATMQAKTKLISGRSYKNPATGEVFKYSGKGRRPAWMAGKRQNEIDDCAVS